MKATDNAEAEKGQKESAQKKGDVGLIMCALLKTPSGANSRGP